MKKTFIVIVVTIGLFINLGCSDTTEKSEPKSKLLLTEPECNIMQDEECLSQMEAYAHQVISMGYDFPEASNEKIDLKAFGQNGYIKSEENSDACAKITWVDGSKQETLYSSKYEMGETYEGVTPKNCDIDAGATMSLSKDGSKVMILIDYYSKDPYGGTGEAIVGHVCEVDFKAKKLTACKSQSVGIH